MKISVTLIIFESFLNWTTFLKGNLFGLFSSFSVVSKEELNILKLSTTYPFKDNHMWSKNKFEVSIKISLILITFDCFLNWTKDFLGWKSSTYSNRIKKKK